MQDGKTTNSHHHLYDVRLLYVGVELPQNVVLPSCLDERAEAVEAGLPARHPSSSAGELLGVLAAWKQ